MTKASLSKEIEELKTADKKRKRAAAYEVYLKNKESK
jgi:hypothetical protein